MSKETIQWLNENTMLGFTKHREKYAHMGWGVHFNEATGQNEAWWHTDDFQNGYSDGIPVEEVERVLFNWEPVETAIMHKRRDGVDASNADGADGIGHYLWVPSERYKGIIHPRTEYEFGVFGVDSYKVHSYRQWLLENVGNVLDAELGIASAGLLAGGGVAYVSVELPEGIEAAGMDIRPQLLAGTSCNGTMSSRYKLVSQISVCDNTLDVALAGEGAEVRIKHSARSLQRIGTIRDTLGLLYQHTEQLVAFIESLSNVDVTDAQFKQIVSAIKPIPTVETALRNGKKVVTNQRAITIAENLHWDLQSMWKSDPRCQQWNGTLLGAFQTVNTWHNHVRPQNDNGVDRVMTATLNGQVGKFDAEFFSIVGGLDINVPESLVLA